jgi:glycopeptide antibiotics resistance protein
LKGLRNKDRRKLPPSHQDRPAGWGPFVFGVAWILIAAGTLFPFQILPAETTAHRQSSFFNWFFEKPPTSKDVLGNILLFTPFGFSLAWLIDRRFRWQISLLLTVAGSCLFSFSIELAQSFIPTRTSSWFDVLANTAGGALGWLVYRALRNKCDQAMWRGWERIIGSLEVKWLATLFVAYAILAIAASMVFGRSAMLKNWDISYGLRMGNSADGKHPWRGQIFEAAIADRAVDTKDANKVFQNGLDSVVPDNMLASYRFTEDAKGANHFENSPRLVWNPQTPADNGAAAQFAAGGAWLESSGPAASMESRIRDSNQFSLFVELATDQVFQPGVNRILELASDPNHADIVLAHYYSSLLLRLRNGLTGLVGFPPDYHERHVLKSPGVHKILFTYDGSTLRFYADGRQGIPMEYGPGNVLFKHLVFLRQYEDLGYKWIYYSLMFVPLGCMLSLATMAGKHISAVWIAAGFLVPSLVLEPAQAAYNHRPVHSFNFFIGVFLTSAAFWYMGRFIPGTAKARVPHEVAQV